MISLSAYFDKHPLHQDYGVPLKASINDMTYLTPGERRWKLCLVEELHGVCDGDAYIHLR